MPAEPSRLRADARGEDVPVAAIARRAGVGVAPDAALAASRRLVSLPLPPVPLGLCGVWGAR
ncbi:hypothetical protein ABZ215_14165 [Amycolatopsis sp. NPDC006131]|uniref:hypothetical protein n=1 Tax=Amycolatopsis sp. NPDC006131 TaxID=3156731 RepID=UPI00339FAE71